MDKIKLLKTLISFASVTPNQAGCIDYISNLLKQYGFEIFYKEFGEGESKVSNLYARLGSKYPNICFAGHVDVVPPGDIGLWKFDPFVASEEDGYIYGRGVVDMKGSIACMISASINYIKNHNDFNNGSISFLLTSDEEGPGIFGTKKMIEYIYNSLNEKIDLAIFGEPTYDKTLGDTICIGRRGSISFELDIIGQQGHVAYHSDSINPNKILVDILYHLNQLELDKGNEYFEPSNLEITSIDCGNKIENIIPNSSSAKFNIRYNNLYNKESLILAIENIIQSKTKNYKLIYRHNGKPFISDFDILGKQFLEVSKEITNIYPELNCKGGTSDARFIQDYCNSIEFGLSPQTAHQINENSKIIDIDFLYKIYYYYLIRILNNR